MIMEQPSEIKACSLFHDGFEVVPGIFTCNCDGMDRPYNGAENRIPEQSFLDHKCDFAEFKQYTRENKRVEQAHMIGNVNNRSLTTLESFQP